jgi:predicted aconitase with swiveling domain
MSGEYQGRSICDGLAEGEALVTKQGVSFLGGVDPETGFITEVDHELHGEKITDKILVLPSLKGSAGALWIIIRLAKNRKGPKAIIIPKADTILVGAVIMAGIPTVDSLPVDPFHTFKTGDVLKVDGKRGTVEIVAPTSSIP